mmetsp:Transcript_4424/g.7220  ORF Transcript_4424/g.7220 Transcript_4424/m.7220 type:complete len:475 (+) Transcript_4424:188-1612(+)|eukprot:CAMPEP_0174981646 /NCGR_PEP_ID=MMETSP0004_2-20121128/16015_1 /TAXON_ID=420556 /ORGANISM="Ochromonas sp., Strain CCMP1393" /LENGTH=474 /DNA_ID=CAMNT_0016233433 /DNA_START=117 /DNA_END=1541 /DNA_ORIENTATION=-
MESQEEAFQETNRDYTNRCFVPEILVEYISSTLPQLKEGLEPTSFFVDGVCVLVDISGFTRLSGTYCALGKEGIDRLQLATNGYLGKLVEIIYSFGGDIIKFAGDAIICVFMPHLITTVEKEKRSQEGDTKTQKRNSRAKATRRSFRVDLLSSNSKNNPSSHVDVGGTSTAAGKDGSALPSMFIDAAPSIDFADLQSTSADFFVGAGMSIDTRTHSGPAVVDLRDKCSMDPTVMLRAMQCAYQLKDCEMEKLTVHVGISCGEICFGMLGGHHDRWECLISGPCIRQLAGCLEDASSREAVVSPQCYHLLQSYFVASRSESDGGTGSGRGINNTRQGNHGENNNSNSGMDSMCINSFSTDMHLENENPQMTSQQQQHDKRVVKPKYDFTLTRLPSGNHKILGMKLLNQAEWDDFMDKDFTSSKKTSLMETGSKMAQFVSHFVPTTILRQQEATTSSQSAGGDTRGDDDVHEVGFV